MHDHSIERWTHPHSYLGDAHGRNERRTGLVVAFTAVAMAVEIIAGFLLHSMALVADGWHMGTHVLALGVAALVALAVGHAYDMHIAEMLVGLRSPGVQVRLVFERGPGGAQIIDDTYNASTPSVLAALDARVPASATACTRRQPSGTRCCRTRFPIYSGPTWLAPSSC